MTPAPATTRDAFLNGRVLANQPVRGFRSGLEALLLAAACPAQGADTVLEAGCGAGVASLCLIAKVPTLHVTGVDIDEHLVALANGNALLNGFDRSFAATTLDVTAPWAEVTRRGLEREAYHHVIANPPFYDDAETRPSRHAGTARSMAKGQAEAWMRFLATVCAPGGTCTIVHRTEALPQLINDLDGRFGGLTVIPVYTRSGTGAKRIIVKGRKGSRAPLAISSGFILQDRDGCITATASAILKGECGLPPA